MGREMSNKLAFHPNGSSTEIPLVLFHGDKDKPPIPFAPVYWRGGGGGLITNPFISEKGGLVRGRGPI